MTPARVVAALAGMFTALLLQATLVGPLAMTVPMSLPAVLVAAVALTDGAATGMSFGFTVGLVADLGSNHPAGVLALSWMALGVVCGLAGDRRTVRMDAVIATVCCAAASLFATLILTLVHAGDGMARLVLLDTLPAGVGDALIALAVVPTVRCFLRTDRLRAPLASGAAFPLGTSHG